MAGSAFKTNIAGGLRPAPKLMLIIGSLQGGGAERQLADMANYWDASGIAVTLATWSGAEVRDFYALSPSVSRLWLNLSVPQYLPFARLASSVRRILKLRRVLTALRPDAVLSFMDISNVYTIMAAMRLGLHIVVAERTHPHMNRNVTWPWRVLRRMCYSHADYVVAQTRAAAHWIEEKCRARVAVIPNSLRKLPNVSCEREPLLLGIGRLTHEKGFDLLLRAFARLAPRFPAWRLSILGDGPERRALTELRDELMLDDRVEFAGEVREVERWMARAGLVVHPSRREGFPNVVLEAMGMGTAVICADCQPGLSELIDDGVNGRFVPVDDVNTLALVMAELMAKPELRERLGTEARKVNCNFEQSIIMEKWDSCVFPRTCQAPSPATA